MMIVVVIITMPIMVMVVIVLDNASSHWRGENGEQQKPNELPHENLRLKIEPTGEKPSVQPRKPHAPLLTSRR